MSGAPLLTVQQLLGDKDTRITMRYSFLSRDFVREVVNNLGQKYRKIGTNLAQKDIDNKPNLHKLFL